VSKHNTDTFKNLRILIYETGDEVLASCVSASVETIKQGYNALDVVKDEFGKELSRIHPKKIAAAIKNEVTDKIGIVYIEGDEENTEALLQASEAKASDIVRNPFIKAFMRLQSVEVLAQITGLKIK